MDRKEFALCIGINDSLKEIIQSSNMDNLIPIFILCPNSIVNYPNINIRNFINKTISSDEIILIKTSSFRFSFTLNEIISMHKNKKEIFIVNDKFLIKLGINKYFLIPTNIYYYSDGINKMLYFLNESRVLLFKQNNELRLSNHFLINNIGKDKKAYILYSLILPY